MEERFPIGLIVLRTFNAIFAAMAFLAPFGLLMSGTGLMALLIAAAMIIYGILLLLLNRYLKLRSKVARTCQIILGCLSLLAFPILTIPGLIVLYFTVIDRGVKEYFAHPRSTRKYT